ncbi:MAG: prolyl oligopeptidase family serine peptidase [Marinilabiliales bacterium]
MKKHFILIGLAIIILSSCSDKKNKTCLEYPLTKKTDVVDNYFGTEVPDPYRWLENDTSTEVKKWVEEQNKLTFDYLEKIPFRNKIKERLTQLWNYPKQSVPFKKNNVIFYYKNNGLQNQSVLYYKKNTQAEEEILIDPNNFSEDGTVALTNIAFSQDNKYIAYSTSTGGSDWNEIFVMDIDTKELIKDHIKWVKFSSIAWYNDGFYYSGYDAPEEGKELSNKNEYHKLFYHKIGTEQSDDKIIMENKEIPSRMYYADVTSDKRFLIVYEENLGDIGMALHVIDHNNPEKGFISLDTNFNYNYSIIDNVDNYLFAKTNNNASKYKIVKIDINNPEQTSWTDIIPESKNVIKSCNLINNNLIVHYMEDAHSVLITYSIDGKFITDIELPSLGSIGEITGEKYDSICYYSFNSFVYPNVIYEYNIINNQSKIYYKSNVDFNPDDYITQQVFYKSKDGTEIPMFITHKKNIKMDGNNPTILYGYGGFNISLTPRFSISNILWLENGGIYAQANLRGGGEYGEEWHLAGTKLNKQNVFDDFIAAAEYLIDNKYTCPEKLAAKGGSNGGLLVGAVINQRPDLFGVALPAVGVMDMLRFQKFTIGAGWVSDYGSSDNEQEFNYILKYSPLHNIKSNVDYPAVLVTTADHDDRVVPAHSFKYIATLQEKNKGCKPTLIRIDVMAGHGSGKPVEKIIDEVTDVFAFTYYNMDINPYQQ